MTVTAASGESLTVGNGNDVIRFTGGSGNTIVAGNGKDAVNANGEADDQITVGSGNDTISAGAASVILAGGGGDTIVVGDGNVVTTADGINAVSLSWGALSIAASGEGDVITAGAGSQISAGEANDKITDGQVLVQLDDSVERSRLDAAQSTVAVSQDALDRTQQLFKRNFATSADLRRFSERSSAVKPRSRLSPWRISCPYRTVTARPSSHRRRSSA